MVPVPPAAVPVEVTHAQVATAVAVDGAPEEDVLVLPLLGDEVGVLEQVVKDIGVKDRLALKLLAELVAIDVLATLLALRQVELDLVGVELPLSALLVLLDGPTIGNDGVGVEVDDVGESALFTDELRDSRCVTLSYPGRIFGGDSCLRQVPDGGVKFAVFEIDQACRHDITSYCCRGRTDSRQNTGNLCNHLVENGVLEPSVLAA